MKYQLVFILCLTLSTSALCAPLEDSEPFKLSSEALITAYQINPLQSDDVYKYKPLRITGRYAQTQMGDGLKKSKPVLILQGNNNFSIHAYGDDDFIPSLSNYQLGQEITLTCMGEGLQNKVINLGNCAISSSEL